MAPNYGRASEEYDGSTIEPRRFSADDFKVKLKTWERVVYNSVFHFFLLLIFCGLIGIGLPVLWGEIWKPTPDTTLESDLRYECAPLRSKQNLTAADCYNVTGGCLWDNFTSPDLIQCYYPVEIENDLDKEHYGQMPRYLVNRTIHHNNDPEEPVVQHTLSLLTAPPYLNKSNADLSNNPIVEHQLSVDLCHFSENHFSVLIRPINDEPDLWSRNLPFNYPANRNCSIDFARTSNAKISVLTDSKSTGLNSDIFQLQIVRKSTGKSLFNMGSHAPFVYAKGFTEITTMLLNDFVWGLGQSYSESFRHNFSQPQTWSLFSQYNDRQLNSNSTFMWGSHPFYLGVDDPTNGDSYGVLLVNSHPLQISINARPSLSFKTNGGHLEFHFFLGPKPAQVVAQLQDFIHKPAMPPYWALGFHVCSAACSIPSPSISLQLIAAGIPVESDCGTSLRQPNDKRQFSLYKYDSKPLPDKSPPRKFLSVDFPQRFYSNENTGWNGFSLRQSSKNVPYYGSLPRCNAQNVLTEESVLYPDLFNTMARRYYENSDEFIEFADGYLLDWNTPRDASNLNATNNCKLLMQNYQWNAANFANMNRQTLCLDSRLSESDFQRDLHSRIEHPLIGDYFALHNLYGYEHAKMVYEFKHKQSGNSKRPFVLSLSTFIGSGRYAGHIGTHINSTWSELRMTLKQVLDFSLFGIPMTGFPVGGHRGARPSDELLRRWYQLASMQPIMVAHSSFDTESRALPEGSVRETIRSTVQARYKLLPYLYTQFHKASTQGQLVTRPLFFEFFDDIKSYGINNQYMLGPSLMVTPALNQSDISLQVYFPKGQRWYEYYSGHLEFKNHGGYREISAVEQNAPLHIRGGHTVVTHFKTAGSIDQMRANSGLQLIAALDNEAASGDLFVDDGISENSRSLNVSFEFHYNNVSIAVADENRFCDQLNLADSVRVNTTLSNIRIYGIIDRPFFNTTDNAVATIYRNNAFHSRLSSVKYQNNFGVLSLDVNLNLCQGSHFFVNWTYPSWQRPEIGSDSTNDH